MLGSLQLVNTVVVRVRQESEGYCSVLDITFSIPSYLSMTARMAGSRPNRTGDSLTLKLTEAAPPFCFGISRETVAWGPSQIYLDTYMPCEVYEEHGICIRNHCRAE